MRFKGNMFVRELIRMKHSIKCTVIYLGGHVCMQFHTCPTVNSIRDLLTFPSVRTENNTEHKNRANHIIYCITVSNKVFIFKRQ